MNFQDVKSQIQRIITMHEDGGPDQFVKIAGCETMPSLLDGFSPLLKNAHLQSSIKAHGPNGKPQCYAALMLALYFAGKHGYKVVIVDDDAWDFYYIRLTDRATGPESILSAYGESLLTGMKIHQSDDKSVMAARLRSGGLIVSGTTDQYNWSSMNNQDNFNEVVICVRNRYSGKSLREFSPANLIDITIHSNTTNVDTTVILKSGKHDRTS